MNRPRGLYDLLLTDSLARELDNEPADAIDSRSLAEDEATERLVDALSNQLRGALEELARGDKAKATSQLRLLNELLVSLRERSAKASALIDTLTDPPRVLRSLRIPGTLAPTLPETGLAAPWLFTAGRGSPSLLTELRREAMSCDQIDILVSFITVSGVRKLIDVLRNSTAPGADGKGRTQIRVLTTTYTGATELAALDELAQLNGCQLKISLDGRRTRLHAKGWIFHRATGFGSAYVGSANLSGAALMGGLEWTTKFTQRGQSALFERAIAHFETLWLDEEFTLYDHRSDADRRLVVAALEREGGAKERGPATFFDIQPKPYQQDMLEQLRFERAQGRNRNLLVAATGTGKTVVAALDYRDRVRELGSPPRLLFVAHRAQILRQAQRTYQEALRDRDFGELLFEGRKPLQHDHLFATIDSVASQKLIDRFGPDHWHTVVIDECHRLAGARFRALASAVNPTHLLGLTATPERADGEPITPFFDSRPDGSPAVELRLWDALDMQLLAPFEYYGCDDPTDFSSVEWDRPGEAAMIDRLVTGNDVRAHTVIQEWSRLTGNPSKGRALVFCVTVKHAEFMAAKFNDAGIPALCVTGETPTVERLRAQRLLASGEVAALVTVDLFNEGVDIPELDTLLLLRPTQSPVLFQQQLGRGLRLWPGKESCLVLDFVGHHRADFRFDRLLGGITGLSRRELADAIDHGFTTLPPGCHIQLQRQTREQVLRSLRTITQQTWSRLATEVRAYASLRGNAAFTLGEFLHDQRVALEEVYREARPSGWSNLKRSAHLLPGEAPVEEPDLSRRLGSLVHVDDPKQLKLFTRVAESGGRFQAHSDEDRARLQMLTYQLDTGRDPLPYSELLTRFRRAPACVRELGELAYVLESRSRIAPRAVPGLEFAPITLHAAYTRQEIMAALGYSTASKRPSFREGVLRLADHRIEVLFVTLDKSEGFHDRVAYHDYAVSADRFHWQTQNTAGPETAAGRRYLESDKNGWQFQLFVRALPSNPFRACGRVSIRDRADVGGSKPMSITWTLDVLLPPKLFAEFSVLRAQA